MGRNGSNACIFIALFMASTYIRSTNKNILELYVGSPLNSSWITLMLSSIIRPCNTRNWESILQCCRRESKLSVRCWKFNSWGYHRSLNHNNRPPNPPKFSGFLPAEAGKRTNLAALIIANGMTICFVGYNNKIYVLDSHPHNAFGPVFGAMLGMTAKPDLEEFLVNIKRQISPAFNVCSLTFVSFWSLT